MALTGPQDCLRRRRTAQERPKTAQEAPQEAPKGPQDAHKRLHEVPKRPLTGLHDASDVVQDALVCGKRLGLWFSQTSTAGMRSRMEYLWAEQESYGNALQHDNPPWQCDRQSH